MFVSRTESESKVAVARVPASEDQRSAASSSPRAQNQRSSRHSQILKKSNTDVQTVCELQNSQAAVRAQLQSPESTRINDTPMTILTDTKRRRGAQDGTDSYAKAFIRKAVADQ
jgi:hypothetical protein